MSKKEYSQLKNYNYEKARFKQSKASVQPDYRR